MPTRDNQGRRMPTRDNQGRRRPKHPASAVEPLRIDPALRPRGKSNSILLTSRQPFSRVLLPCRALPIASNRFFTTFASPSTSVGYPPTLREIGAHMGIRSTNGVNDHLRALERKGYLTREDMKSRALRPCDVNARHSDAVAEAGLDNVAANDLGSDCRDSGRRPHRGRPPVTGRGARARHGANRA